MAHDNLLKLSLSILRNAPKAEPAFVLPVQGTASDSAFEELPPHLRERVSVLLSEIRELVPSDFVATCEFDHEGMWLAFECDDGNTGTFGGHRPLFTSRKSMRRQLRSMPWDELRKEHFEKCDFLDSMCSLAEDRPPNIPSSKAAAEAYAHELRSIFDTLGGKKISFPFVMVFTREGEGVVDVQEYHSRREVVHETADLMTVQCEILAVIENGRRWEFDEIEEMKREAVEGLGPISRAKAERRFPMQYDNLSR